MSRICSKLVTVFFVTILIRNYKRVGWSNSNPLPYSLSLFTLRPHSRPSVHHWADDASSSTSQLNLTQIQNRFFRFIIRIGANFHLHSGSQTITENDVTCWQSHVSLSSRTLWSDSEKFYTSRFCCASPLVLALFFVFFVCSTLFFCFTSVYAQISLGKVRSLWIENRWSWSYPTELKQLVKVRGKKNILQLPKITVWLKTY